jgi:hypothetical protein
VKQPDVFARREYLGDQARWRVNEAVLPDNRAGIENCEVGAAYRKRLFAAAFLLAGSRL